MTDHDLEQRLRAWYQAEVADSERAPFALRSKLASLAMPSASDGPARRAWPFPPLFSVASTTLAATAIVVAFVVGLTVIMQPPALAPSPAPVPSSTSVPSSTPATPVPSPTHAVSASPSERVRGWPDTSRNGPGLFSWGGGCAPGYCNYGWMHNGYGDGNIEITIGQGGVPKDGATPATVAGRDALYERIEDEIVGLQEDWQVDVEEVSIHIRLTATPEASEAELAEAHAIIESMYIEALRENDFRLVFRLATENWDSG